MKNAPNVPPRLARPEPAPCSEVPTSNRPERFSATASITKASTATTGGDCSWKPQPIAEPAAFSAMSPLARARNVRTEPAPKASPCLRASAWAPPWPARDAAFIARIGNTQGIRLRISPPRKAKAAAAARPRLVSPAGGLGRRSKAGGAWRRRAGVRCDLERLAIHRQYAGQSGRRFAALECVAGGQRQGQAVGPAFRSPGGGS